MSKLTCITFTHQGANWVQHTLASLLNVVDEVIVVDGGREGYSDDGTLDKIREFENVCKVLEIENHNFDWPREVLETDAKIILVKSKFVELVTEHVGKHVFTELGFKNGKQKYTDWECTGICRAANLGLDLAVERGAEWIFRIDDDWIFYPNIVTIRDIANGTCPVPGANSINVHLYDCMGDPWHTTDTYPKYDLDAYLKVNHFCLPGLFHYSDGFYFCSSAMFPYQRNSSLNYITYLDRRIVGLHGKFAPSLDCATEKEKLDSLFKHFFRTVITGWKDPGISRYRHVESIEELKAMTLNDAKNHYEKGKIMVKEGNTIDKADRRLILPYPPQVFEMNPLEYVRKGYPYGLPIEYIENAEENSYFHPQYEIEYDDNGMLIKYIDGVGKVLSTLHGDKV
jgi:hypothetical protein